MTGRIIIDNGILVTMNDNDDVLFGGHLTIDGGQIVEVGSGRYIGEIHPGDRVIDATDKIVMPGLVDLHYHTALAKGYSDHLPLWEYLDACWYPIIRALTPEEAYWAALASYAESIKGGVTTVNDMYRQLQGLAKAADAIGIRAVLSNDVALPEHKLDTLEDNKKAFEDCHGMGDGRIEVYVGIEWLPLASPELLRDARQLANDLGTGIHIHLNESLTEVEDSKARFGKRPTEVAYEAGLLGRDCIAAHCVWLSDTEIALMKTTDTQISHNPSSNAKLGNGIARLPEMQAAGLNVGLGHDAAECNNSRDLFQVMKFAAVIHRAARVDASLQPAPEIVKMATRHGSQALRHEGGILQRGKNADLILIDTLSPMFTPLRSEDPAHVFSHLTYAANGSCVHTTIIDGKVVMEDRRLTMIDEEMVVREANRAFAAVLERIEG